MALEVAKNKNITIKLEKEIGRIRTNVGGKEQIVDHVDERGQLRFQRNDLFGLQNLFSKFDTREYSTRDWLYWTTFNRKLHQLYLDNTYDLEITYDESLFLKRYLTGFTEERKKQAALISVEVEALMNVLNQLK